MKTFKGNGGELRILTSIAAGTEFLAILLQAKVASLYIGHTGLIGLRVDGRPELCPGNYVDKFDLTERDL
jgi:hypothetical protein